MEAMERRIGVEWSGRNPLYLSLNTYFEVVSSESDRQRARVSRHRSGSGWQWDGTPSGGPRMSP